MDFTPWTPAAHGVPMVPEPVLEAEFAEEDLDKWVDEFGSWWSRYTLGGGSCTTLLVAWSGGMSPGRAGVASSSWRVFARRCTTTGAEVFFS